jgi:hypothetical protein
MPTTTSPPILIWQPGGGTPTWTPAPPPAGHAPPENGLTVLTIGQNYVDVVFVTVQPRADWTFAGLEVVNVTDTAPLNIWVGVATSKTRNGFRVYLNGLPDTGNYYLDWSINGGTVADAGTATTYTLSGPDNGPNGAGTTFTVALPAGTTLDEPMTVTPDDGGVPGTFSPATVELTSDMPSANFVYTPGSYGARTITVTNDQFLTDPGGIAFTAVVGTYLLSGPASGTTGVASTNFTVALPSGGVTLNTITVTPTDALPGDAPIGAFIPATVSLTTAAPSATFTYTAPAPGVKTISTTNNRGLTNPAPLTYTATPASLHDGDPVSTWVDSSLNGHDASQTGSARPIFKTGILGGKPVVRFTSAGHSGLNLASAISADGPWTIFAVMKAVSGSQTLFSLATGGSVSFPAGPLENSDAHLYFGDRALYTTIPTDYTAAWHIFSAASPSGGTGGFLFIDGASVTTGGFSLSSPGNFDRIGYNAFTTPAYSDGDLAEIIMYSGDVAIRAKLLLVLTVLIQTGQIPSTEEADAMLEAGDLVGLEAYLIEHGVPVEEARDTLEPMTIGDRANIEKYLGTKFSITVSSGGTAVSPDTVAGLLGWWKSDSLG